MIRKEKKILASTTTVADDVVGFKSENGLPRPQDQPGETAVYQAVTAWILYRRTAASRHRGGLLTLETPGFERCSSEVQPIIGVPRSEETTLRAPICPTCDTASRHTSTRTATNVQVADCVCANGHIWSVHWLRPVNLAPKDICD